MLLTAEEIRRRYHQYSERPDHPADRLHPGVAAPVYLKFGPRNSPDVYPSGTRRAAIAMEHIAKYCPTAKMSPLGDPSLGIPIPAGY